MVWLIKYVVDKLHVEIVAQAADDYESHRVLKLNEHPSRKVSWVAILVILSKKLD